MRDLDNHRGSRHHAAMRKVENPPNSFETEHRERLELPPPVRIQGVLNIQKFLNSRLMVTHTPRRQRSWGCSKRPSSKAAGSEEAEAYKWVR